MYFNDLSLLFFKKLFMQGYVGDLNKAYQKANMLAGEAVSNIRTVAAFCSEKKVLDLYARELVEPSRGSCRRGQSAGIFYGLSQFFIFSSYGLALWYAALLQFFRISAEKLFQNKNHLNKRCTSCQSKVF